ncbi:MAG: hypothetical protein AUG87_10800 [Candidatus Rokubacteria bacterium 13_1_20CM_4_70_14]|nr:MAG: hypothetical protein AUG87_10800 [Candidatus Rokubacteria bacterium 13_1_20CM_4_70_14]
MSPPSVIGPRSLAAVAPADRAQTSTVGARARGRGLEFRSQTWAMQPTAISSSTSTHSSFGDRLARLWGSPARARRQASPRERRVYLTYGLLAGSYSAWLLGVIAWALGRLVTGGYRGVGTVLSAGLLVAALQGRLGRWVSRPALAEAWRGRLASVIDLLTRRLARVFRVGLTGSGGPRAL